MKIVLAAGVLGLLFGYAVGAAQTGSRFGGFAEFKGMSCWSWVPATSQLKEGDLVRHAPEHAWTYGFVSGAAYMSPVRLRSLSRPSRSVVTSRGWRADGDEDGVVLSAPALWGVALGDVGCV